MITQLIWLIPSAARVKKPTICDLGPLQWEEIPGHVGARSIVLVGEMFGRASPVETETKLNVAILSLVPGAIAEVPHVHGGGCFLYCRTGGPVSLNESTSMLEAGEIAVVQQKQGEHLRIANTGQEECTLVFGNGEKIDEPWVKLKTHNGFLIASTLEEALQQENIIKKVGLENYGKAT